MSRAFKILLSSIFVTLILLVVVNSFKLRGYQSYLLEKAEEVFNIRIISTGGTKVKFFGIVLNNVKILRVNHGNSEDLYYDMKIVEVNISPFSLPFFGLKVNSIKFSDSVINDVGFFGEISQIPYKVLLENVTIKNDRLFLDMRIKDATYLRSKDGFKLSGRISGAGENLYNFFILQNSNGITVSLNSENRNISFSQTGDQYKVSGSGSDLAQILNDLTAVKKVGVEGNQFKIEGKLTPKEKDFTLDIESDLIELSARSQVIEGKQKIKVDVSKLNLDLFKLQSSNLSDYLEYLIPAESELYVDLSLNSITFHAQDTQGTNLSFYLKDGRIAIEKLESKLPGGLSLTSTGEVTRSDGFTRINGKLSISGNVTEELLRWIDVEDSSLKNESLWLSSDFILGPNMVIMLNSKLKTDSLSVSSPSLNYKVINKTPKLRGEISISGLNLDDSFTRKNLLKIANTAQSWNNNLLINASNLVLNKKSIDETNINLNSADGEHISFVNTRSKNIKIGGKLAFNTSTRDFSIYMSGDSFDLDLLRVPGLFNIKSDNNQSAEITWSKARLPVFDDSLSVSCDLAVKNTFKNGANIGSLETRFKLANNIFSLENFSVTKDFKSFNLVTNIVLSEKSNTLKMSFTTKNFEVTDFLKNALEIDYLSGYFNITGNLDSYGSTISDLVANLSGAVNMGGSDVVVSGVDFALLSEELQKIDSQNTLDVLTRIKVFERGTQFKSINGSSNIRGGILGTSLKFVTDTTSGIVSSNLDLKRMDTKTIVRIMFIAPRWGGQTANIDMQIEGNIWYPKVFFDNNKIYDMIRIKNEQFKKAT